MGAELTGVGALIPIPAPAPIVLCSSSGSDLDLDSDLDSDSDCFRNRLNQEDVADVSVELLPKLDLGLKLLLLARGERS